MPSSCDPFWRTGREHSAGARCRCETSSSEAPLNQPARAPSLQDGDPRSRGYGASLLANLSHLQVGLLERAPVAHAPEREAEPVVRATLGLAVDTSTYLHLLDPGEEAILVGLPVKADRRGLEPLSGESGLRDACGPPPCAAAPANRHVW